MLDRTPPVAETDAERIVRVAATRRFRDAGDVQAWVCAPPAERTPGEEAALAAEWQAVYDAAASFD